MSKTKRRVLSELDLLEHEKHDPMAKSALKEYREIIANGGRPIVYYQNDIYTVIDENEPVPPPAKPTESPLR